MADGRLVGVPDDVLADPRVQEALGVVERGIEKEAAVAVTSGPADRLAKYGLTLRKSGLQHKAIVSRIMFACPNMPSIVQALVWLYTLAAPILEVYAAVQKLEDGKTDEFNVAIDAWFAAKNLAGDALNDVLTAMGEDIALSNKLAMPSTDNKEGTIPNG